MERTTLILGAGGVGHVVAHKAAQNNHILGNICIASRTINKCKKIIESINKKNSLKDKKYKIFFKQIDALQENKLKSLAKEINADIIINAASAFVNIPTLKVCIDLGIPYIDTAVHEYIDSINPPPPWYANNEWKYSELCEQKNITAILSCGFDPGMVNSYCAYAKKHLFNKINSIDILDINQGDHGQFFATNFDPEINLREILETVIYWEDGKWQYAKEHSIKKFFNFPEVGKQSIYLMGHEEVHSLARFMDCDNIRFWMGFDDHYIKCFEVLHKIGLLSEQPVILDNGESVVPIKVVKACLPEPNSLAKNYTGKTYIGNLITGESQGKNKSVFIYNICDHEECYKEVESQAITYTAGLPPVAAAILVKNGTWDVKRMAHVEELDPDPFLKLCGEMGLTTSILENPEQLTDN